MASFRDKFKNAFNAFVGGEERTRVNSWNLGSSNSFRPDRGRRRFSNERSILSSIITRIGIDVAAIDIRHIKKDENGRYQSDMVSDINDCLTFEANLDQAARHFRQDIATSMCDWGALAVVPILTDEDPEDRESVKIYSMRVGEIISWHPEHVRVRLYDERDGQTKELLVSKRSVAIIENPLYSVMNEPNSTLQRLIRKLNLLDAIDEQSGSGKLDMIIQLPYVIKSETQQAQAQKRAKDIEVQLKSSQFGIAYTDGTEKITQLNRPVENKLLNQIEFLTEMLYGQLGLTKAVFNGTASEPEMLNYHNRTIEPMLTAIVEAFRRSFLSKTARTQGQDFMFFRDPFKMLSISDVAEIGDKLTRNEIVTSNEMRSFLGLKPSTDPNADKLKNKNIPDPDAAGGPTNTFDTAEQDALVDQAFNSLESSIDDILSDPGGSS
ncbi:portal protein [Arthrobacter phage Arcadia]|uniref:Portal protein n=6 Tax=Mudcatvirus TaxID=1982088 RepID=A0A222Z7D5_9CAUD|nr:portal protein [Arthrobacter phage Arcadia]YP_010666095.1 portal protein [Arthrobacter phage Tribby]YP_010666197.1 portal protein [Arthrobacter phage Cheesy]YP_010666298.1 portal protein [Arthrobacter phage Correa]YP_010666688.1 portal protein [Arthrobacter phage Kardesai]YP_010666789.1 portal protein [Arthrobacter phage Dynamite]ASR80167.1 portal protein [Arthrobacter phage Elsa]ASR80364.1 portal protein [Arthrobacter phage Nason]QFP94978.1 portal protein [Arthrobacter phage NapoleonB]